MRYARAARSFFSGQFLGVPASEREGSGLDGKLRYYAESRYSRRTSSRLNPSVIRSVPFQGTRQPRPVALRVFGGAAFAERGNPPRHRKVENRPRRGGRRFGFLVEAAGRNVFWFESTRATGPRGSCDSSRRSRGLSASRRPVRRMETVIMTSATLTSERFFIIRVASVSI